MVELKDSTRRENSDVVATTFSVELQNSSSHGYKREVGDCMSVRLF